MGRRISRMPAFVGVGILLITAAACAQNGSASPSAGLGCGAGFRQMFSSAVSDGADHGDLFSVYFAVSLPDGSVAISYNPNSPGAGDQPKATPDRLVEVGADGTLTRVELPVLAGARVDDSVIPLVAAPEGTLYLYDGPSDRVVAIDPEGGWSVVAALSRGSAGSGPLAALGPNGELYLGTVSSVLRVEADGALTRIAGNATVQGQDIQGPQPPLVGLPLPATQVNLPLLNGLAVAPDGAIFMTAGSLILRLGGGLLTEAANSLSLAGVVSRSTGQSDVVFRGLSVAADGSLFTAAIGDTVQVQHIVGLATAETLQAGPETVTPGHPDVYAVNNGAVVGASSGMTLLVTRRNGTVCAYDS